MSQKSKFSAFKQEAVGNVNFHDEKYERIVGRREDRRYGEVQRALVLLAMCNDALIEEEEAEGKVERSYNASSPDELALINFAKYSGVELHAKAFDGSTTILVNNGG